MRCIDEEIPFEIPEMWEWCRLSSVADIAMGSSPKSENLCSDNQFIEFHQGKVYFTDKIINNSNQYTKKTTKEALANSVLLCVRAPVGEVNITDRNLCIGRGLAAVKGLLSINEEFLFYWLQPFKKSLIDKATGSTFIAITADTVREMLIPLPPIKEQNRILNCIWNLLSLMKNMEAGLN